MDIFSIWVLYKIIWYDKHILPSLSIVIIVKCWCQWPTDQRPQKNSHCVLSLSFSISRLLSLSHGGQESGEVMWRSQQIVSQAGVRGGSQPQHGRPGGPCAPSPILQCPCPAEPSIPRRHRTPPQPCPALPNCCLLAAGEDHFGT